MTVGWSVLYGLGYLILAAFLLWNPLDWLNYWWGVALLATAAVFAFALLLLVPALMPRHAMTAIERQQLDRARNSASMSTDTDDAFLAGLIDRGQAYRFLVELVPEPDGQPSLTKHRGRRLAERVRTDGRRPWPHMRPQPDEESDGIPGSGLPPIQQPRTHHDLAGEGGPPPADARSMPPTPDASLGICFEEAVDPQSRAALDSPSFDT